MELINTGNDLFDPISEPFFLHHPGFYPAATPVHCRGSNKGVNVMELINTGETAPLAELLAQYSFERCGHVGRLIDDFFRECLELFTADKIHLPFALLELFLELGILEHFGEAIEQDHTYVLREESEAYRSNFAGKNEVLSSETLGFGLSSTAWCK